jgi:hypothetical protein
MLGQLVFQPWPPYDPRTWQPGPPPPQFYFNVWGDLGFFIILFVIIAVIHGAIKESTEKKRRRQEQVMRTAANRQLARQTEHSGTSFVGRIVLDMIVALIAGIVLKAIGGS